MARKNKGKALKMMYARRRMVKFLLYKTGAASFGGRAPPNAELLARCEDHLKLSTFVGLPKMERIERITTALGEQYPRIKATKAVKTRKIKTRDSKDFYNSDRWRELRYRVLKANNGCCECCGRSKKDGVVLHVDHIKPRSRHPELEWSIGNMQILCADCNLGKRAWDETDWREPKLATLMGERIDTET